MSLTFFSWNYEIYDIIESSLNDKIYSTRIIKVKAARKFNEQNRKVLNFEFFFFLL